MSIAALAWFVAMLPASVWTWGGTAIFTALLVAEHILVTPGHQKNIGIAFGTLNGLASTLLAACLIVGMLTA